MKRRGLMKKRRPLPRVRSRWERDLLELVRSRLRGEITKEPTQIIIQFDGNGNASYWWENQ